MKDYLWAIQEDDGTEVMSARFAVDKVSRVTADVVDGRALIALDASPQVLSPERVREGVGLWLCRWPADDKLAKPVRKRIRKATG